MVPENTRLLGYTITGIPVVFEAERRSRDAVEDVRGLFLTPEQTSMRQSKADVRRLGFRGYSNMTRPELVDIIESNRRPPPMTLNDLNMGRLRDLVRRATWNLIRKRERVNRFECLMGTLMPTQCVL